MPKPYTRVQSTPLFYAETGINPGAISHHGRFSLRKVGEAFAKGDPRGTYRVNRAYSGFTARLAKIIKTNNPMWGYAPAPIDGLHGPLVSQLLSEMPAEPLNKAYSRFVEQLHGISGQLGASLGESGELPGQLGAVRRGVKNAARRIERSTLKMVRSYRKLRKGNLPGCLDELGVRMKRKHRRAWDRARTPSQKERLARTTAHQASSLWLQYWFGWAPLANEVYTAVDILCSDRYNGRFKVSATATMSFSKRGQVGYVGGDDYFRSTQVDYKMSAKQVAWARVTNPNFARNTALGINNPLGWLWEWTPFSFVIDWFTNVGEVLNSYTDLWGFDLSDSAYTVYLRGTIVTRYGQPARAGGQTVCTWKAHNVIRTLGFRKPTLLRPSLMRFGTSITRAATAVSLLVALFIGR